jgi:mono/diheme cytochrome c family protein
VGTEVKSGLKRFFTSVSSVSSVVACFVAFTALVCAQGNGWTVPETAAAEKNPLSASPALVKKGESLYKANCAGCHGPNGLGDGPDVDKKDRRNRPANLTLSRNPEGIAFYKIWNGRKDPDMPAFKTRLTRDEAWAVVSHIISLRP